MQRASSAGSASGSSSLISPSLGLDGSPTDERVADDERGRVVLYSGGEEPSEFNLGDGRTTLVARMGELEGRTEGIDDE